MSQISNITVKNGASTPVDVTFVVYQPQSGSDVSLWLLSNASTTRNKWPRLTLSVRKTPNKAMKHKLGFNIPYFDSVTGEQLGSIPFSGEMTLPDNCPQSVIDDAAAYVTNIYNSNLIKETIKTASPAI